MTVEVWFRNPHSYIRELVECGQYNIVWDRGTLVKKRIDANKHAELYFGATFPYRLLLVGDQGAAELDAEHTLENPKAVYPVWSYGEDLHLLENYLAYPAGGDPVVCATKGVPPDELPVLGQEHRVVIKNLPAGNLSVGRTMLRTLKELQEDYPEAIMHIHGTYSWNTAFGIGLKSADVDPRMIASKGRVTLPMGNEVPYEKTFNKSRWTKQLGYMPADLAVPRVRCMFNIKSALWAAEHFQELFRYRSNRDGLETDITTPDAQYNPPQTKYIAVMSKAKPGDKFTCNTCSLMDECKYARDGAVCSVPGAEPNELSSYFGTRDSGIILDGLAILMKSQVKRYERGMQDEMVNDELDPEVTKIQVSLFDQGVKLAKLIDPQLRSGPKIGINIGGGSAVQVNSGGNPRQAIAAAMKELEQRGIPRDQITPEMMQDLFASMEMPAEAQRRAIQAVPIDVEEVDESDDTGV